MGNIIVDYVVKEEEKKKKEHERRAKHETNEEVLSSEIARFMLNNDMDGAWEYLNEHFMEEIIDDCQHQEHRNFSLETVLVKRKNKYVPFYQKIGKTMPENLSSITADELCKILEVENLHIKDSFDSNSPIIPEKTDKELKKEWIWVSVIAVLFIIAWKAGWIGGLLDWWNEL